MIGVWESEHLHRAGFADVLTLTRLISYLIRPAGQIRSHWHGVRENMAMRRMACRIISTACVLAAVMLGGCQGTQPPTVLDELSHGQSTRRWRSLVFATPQLRRLTKRMLYDPDAPTPWYASRNDARLTTFSGIQTSTVEFASTFTYERQTQHGPRVRDHINITTYRSSSTESIR